MTNKTLVERLENLHSTGFCTADFGLIDEAAARIEELEAALETVRGNAKRWEGLALRYKREFAERNAKLERVREAADFTPHDIESGWVALSYTRYKEIRAALAACEDNPSRPVEVFTDEAGHLGWDKDDD